MRAIAALIAFFVNTVSISAQSVTVNFDQLLESVPLGTPVDQIALPVPVAIRQIGGCCGAQWRVEEAIKDVPSGVPINKVSGRAIVCRTSVLPEDSADREICPFLEMEFLWDMTALGGTLAGYGCTASLCTGFTTTCGFPTQVFPGCGVMPVPCAITIGSGHSTIGIVPDSRGVRGDTNNFCDRDPFERDVAIKFAENEVANSLSIGRYYSLYEDAAVPQYRLSAVRTRLFDNFTVSFASDPCPFSDFIHLLPPFGPVFGAGYQRLGDPKVTVEGGQMVRISWEPITSFAPSTTDRGIALRATAFPNDGRDPRQVSFSPPTPFNPITTSADLTPPRLGRGDYFSEVIVFARQRCGSGDTFNSVSVALRVRDRPEPIRIDSVWPQVALPGSTIVIRGTGFVGRPQPTGAAVSSSSEGSFSDESLRDISPSAGDDFLPPGNISVLIGGIAAPVTIENSSTIWAVVPPLPNGSAGIVVQTVYGTATLSPGNGFTVGEPASTPRRRAVRR